MLVLDDASSKAIGEVTMLLLLVVVVLLLLLLPLPNMMLLLLSNLIPLHLWMPTHPLPVTTTIPLNAFWRQLPQAQQNVQMIQPLPIII